MMAHVQIAEMLTLMKGDKVINALKMCTYLHLLFIFWIEQIDLL